jgi:hypothetical protein
MAGISNRLGMLVAPFLIGLDFAESGGAFNVAPEAEAESDTVEAGATGVVCVSAAA